MESKCHKIADKLNYIITDKSEKLINQLNHCDEDHSGCGCDGNGGGASNGMVDLFVLADTSGSMSATTYSISLVIEDAIKKAHKSCEDVDLRVVPIGLAQPSGWFTNILKPYLMALHGPTVSLAMDRLPLGNLSEQGANAIEDIAKYADWREDACRVILFIGDEEPDSAAPRENYAHEQAEVDAAIAMANANDVTVFVNYVNNNDLPPIVESMYQQLVDDTGGKLLVSKIITEDNYVEFLQEMICNTDCGGKGETCKAIEIPKIQPCISIKWGESECDCLESSDYEVMTICVKNCYSNITMNNFKIAMLSVTNEDGTAVATLPNDKPSVELVPVGPHCFGDIAPCSTVCREFVIKTNSAKSGRYKINVTGVCYDVSFHYDMDECFVLDICKD